MTVSRYKLSKQDCQSYPQFAQVLTSELIKESVKNAVGRSFFTSIVVEARENLHLPADKGITLTLYHS